VGKVKDMMKAIMIDYASPRNLYSDGLCNRMSKEIELYLVTDQKVDRFNPAYKIKPILYNGGATKIVAPIQYSKSLIRLVFDIIFNRYDIIHIQTFKNSKIESSLYRLLSRLGFNFVHTVHNVLPHEPKESDIKTFGRFYNCCKKLIVHNEYSKQKLIELFSIDEKKISVIPHSIYENSECIKNTNTGTKGISRFLFFGKIRKYKGIDVLLKAIAHLPNEARRNMQFVIAGEQFSKLDNTDYNKMIEDYGIGEVVTFKPYRISQSEKQSLFLESDACICPYKEIYGSGVLLEAYTFGCPVIVSDIPVFIEDTDNGKTGMIFVSEDHLDLANKIMEFSKLPSQDIKRFRNNIDRLNEEKHNWNIASKRTLNLYNQTVQYD
jgi:glycosyltransferase involved in cell wall biosynthesis